MSPAWPKRADAVSGSPVARGCARFDPPATTSPVLTPIVTASRAGWVPASLLGEPRQASPSLVCGSQCAQRIVLVDCRQPEDRAEPCRRDRLDGAAVALDGVLQLVEGLCCDVAKRLGIEPVALLG